MLPPAGSKAPYIISSRVSGSSRSVSVTPVSRRSKLRCKLVQQFNHTESTTLCVSIASTFCLNMLGCAWLIQKSEEPDAVQLLKSCPYQDAKTGRTGHYTKISYRAGAARLSSAVVQPMVSQVPNCPPGSDASSLLIWLVHSLRCAAAICVLLPRYESQKRAGIATQTHNTRSIVWKG